MEQSQVLLAMVRNQIYRVELTNDAPAFTFQVLDIGTRGMTGYADGSASWPRSVEYSTIRRIERV